MSLRLVSFHRRFSTPFRTSNFEFWVTDLQFWIRMHTFKQLSVLAGLQSVKIYIIPQRHYFNDYVSVFSWRATSGPCRIYCTSTPAIFFFDSNLAISIGCCHDLTWAAVKPELTVATLLTFLATVRHEVPSIVYLHDNSLPPTQSGGVVTFLPNAVHKAIKEVLKFSLLRESDYDGSMAMSHLHVSRNFFSDSSSIGWFPYSWGTTEVSNFPAFSAG